MIIFNWDEDKNKKLKKERNVSFEEIIVAINAECTIESYDNPNNEKYPGQKIYVVNFKEYIYLIPYIEKDNEIFLKTIIPSKKATKKYLEEIKMKDNKLDFEEQEILNLYESGKLKRTKNEKNEIDKAKSAAKSTLSKTKHISIRLSEKDLVKLKKKALETGIPYQTLVGALIHQYTEDKIKIAI